MTSAHVPRHITVFKQRIADNLSTQDLEDLDHLGNRMLERVKQFPGFVDFKNYTADDGEIVSIAIFESAEDERYWREDPEHREAQRQGREKYFTFYDISVCREERRYGTV